MQEKKTRHLQHRSENGVQLAHSPHENLHLYDQEDPAVSLVTDEPVEFEK